MSRFSLVLDVSCDLPEEYNAHPQIKFLPTHVVVGDRRRLDIRDPRAALDFYVSDLSSPSAVQGYSEPLSVDDMVKAFHEQLATQYDEVLGVFVASSRSAIYTRAKQAIGTARTRAHQARAQVGNMTPLQADCLDSKALFSGYAVQALDLLDALAAGQNLMQLIERQQKQVSRTYTYMAPGNVDYILKRASFKGEKSVSALAGLAAKTLSITPILRGHQGETAAVGRKFGKINARETILSMAEKFLGQGLLISKHICLSYSGLLHDVKTMPTFAQLQKKCNAKGVKLHLAQMSMTGSVNVGPGALTLGVLASPHDPSDVI